MNDEDWIEVENPMDRPIHVIVAGNEVAVKANSSLQVRRKDNE